MNDYSLLTRYLFGRKTVVYNEKTIGFLSLDGKSLEVLQSHDSFVRNDGSIFVSKSAFIREADRFDFHRLRVSYSCEYLVNNDNYDGIERSSQDILDEIYIGDEQYKALKQEVLEGDKFATYEVKHKNGVVIRYAALCLFHNVLSDYSSSKGVVSYKPVS